MSRALCAALVLIVSVPAGAAETLAVVDLSTPPSMLALGAQLTREVLRSAREQRYVVIPPEEVRRALGELSSSELQRCAGEPSCLAERLSALAPTRVAGGSLERDETHYRVKLWVVDARARTVVATLERRIPIASRRLVTDVTAVIPLLLEGKPPPKGRLSVSADVEGAGVVIDGEAKGLTPLTVELPLGDHVVRVSREGAIDVERVVEVTAEAAAKVEARMLSAPLALAEEGGRTPVTTTEVIRPSGFRVPGAAIGAWVVGAGALGTGVGFAVASKGNEAIDPNRARTQQRWSNALFIAAGVAAVTGLVLVTVDSLAPGAGPRVAAAPIGGGYGVFAWSSW